MKRVLRKTCTLDVISRLTRANRVDIMLYHGFCEGSDRDRRFARLLPIEEFEEHLRIFARYGRPLSLAELKEGASRGILITFDDGYANNYELAFPLLEKYRFPATVFLTTGFLDRTATLWGDRLEFLILAASHRNTQIEWKGELIPLRWAGPGAPARVTAQLKRRLRTASPDEIRDFLASLEACLQVRYGWDVIPRRLRPLRWEDVRAMRRSGLVAFGAHTVSHPVLSRCVTEVQRSEVVGSKRRVEEEVGETCFAFAYPYGKPGDYTAVTKQIVKDAGYTHVLTAESGFNRPSSCDVQELKRWGADISSDELSFLVSGAPVIKGYLSGRLTSQAPETSAARP